MRKCIDLTSSGWLSPIESEQMFDAAGERVAFELWEMVQPEKWNLPKAGYEKIQDAVVRNMASADPEKAIRTLVSTVPTKSRHSLLSIVYKKMHEDAPGTCVAKVEALLPEMDEATGQQLIECVARTALESKDLVLAKQWIERLTNRWKRKDIGEAYATALTRRNDELKKGIKGSDGSVPNSF